jgi:hypothetical protein
MTQIQVRPEQAADVARIPMKKPEVIPSSIRLLAAAIASLLLLIWIVIGAGFPPVIVAPGRSVSLWPMMITAGLATVTLVILCPVILFGRTAERWVSVLLGAFPLLVLLVIVLWTAGVAQRGSF